MRRGVCLTGAGRVLRGAEVFGAAVAGGAVVPAVVLGVALRAGAAVVGVAVVGVVVRAAVVDAVHPASEVSATSATTIGRRDGTRPTCHDLAARPVRSGPRYAVPMTMRGRAAGPSHRMIDTSLACGIDTQPAVGSPTETCRKNALPLPWRTPVGELRVL